jgi:ClpP class serine protease
MDWLLHEDVLPELQALVGLVPTAEQRAALVAELSAHDMAIAAGEPRILKLEGSEAQITIDGLLMERPSFASMFMSRGTASYSEIRAALVAAEADPRVKSIVLNVNSPGGSVDGMFETLDTLAQVTKKTSVVAARAQSAAYALSAMAGPIAAASRSSQFGSIGVAAQMMVLPEVVTLTSTDAPEKAPDPRTPEGKATIVKRLDATNEMFVDAIAKGRTMFGGSKVTADGVKQNFGRGASLFAAEAKAAGLIDKAPKAPKLARGGFRAEDDSEADVSANAAVGGKETIMDIKTLKTDHPALYAAVLEEGRLAGVEAGAKAERDRCGAHITMGEASGDLATAIGAIKDGSEMTQTMQAKYLSAGMNKAAITARGTETAAAAAVVAGAASATAAGDAASASGDEPDMGDKTVAVLEARRQGVAA